MAAKAEASTEPRAKLGAMRTPIAGLAGEELREPCQPVRVPAGGADDGVHAVFDGEADVGLGAFGDGQVHHDLGAGCDQGVQGIVPAQGRHELQVRGGFDGLDGLGAHAPVGAQHGDCELFGHAINPTAGRHAANRESRVHDPPARALSQRIRPRPPIPRCRR